MAHRHVGVRIDGRRWNARETQTGAQVLRMFDRIREEEYGTVAGGFSDAVDDELVAVLVVGQSPQRALREFVEPAEMLQFFRGKREWCLVGKCLGFDRGENAVSCLRALPAIR